MNNIIKYLTDNALRVGLIKKEDAKLFESMCKVAYSQGMADQASKWLKKDRLTEEQYIDAVERGELQVSESTDSIIL